MSNIESRTPIFFTEQPTSNVIERVRNSPYPVILLDGPSGAGKNVYALELAHHILKATGKQSTLWETDYSQHDRTTRKAFIEPSLADMFRWDHLQESVDRILHAAKQGEHAQLSHLYMRERGGTISEEQLLIHPGDSLILYGVYAASTQVREVVESHGHVPITFFVDADEHVRLLRTQQRALQIGSRTPTQQAREMNWFNRQYADHAEALQHNSDFIIRSHGGMFLQDK